MQLNKYFNICLQNSKVYYYVTCHNIDYYNSNNLFIPIIYISVRDYINLV